MKLSDNSRDYTTFNRYAYDRMPYGECSVLEVSHKVMEQMFKNIDRVRIIWTIFWYGELTKRSMIASGRVAKTCSTIWTIVTS